MQQTILIVPGLGNSGPTHWQSWLETQYEDARRVRGIDWHEPVLARWAAEVRREIDESEGVVWLVAHSYGCLASVVAAADRLERVAGLLLVAPADPARFTALGMRSDNELAREHSLDAWIPAEPLAVPSIVVGSRTDPWASFETISRWAEHWGSRLVDEGAAGHINVESGHGPWPRGRRLFDVLRQSYLGLPLGSIDDSRIIHRGKRGALARLRHLTRFNWDSLIDPGR